MKILVLNGSPKAQSDTMQMTRAFLSGLTGSGEHPAEVIDLIRKDVRPCTGCFGCWQKQDGRCVQQDDQNEILAKLVAADVVVWSFPLYCYGMPSHVKAVLDRTIPLAKMSMKQVDGKVIHDSQVDLSAKKYVVLCGCGFPDWQGNFDALRIQCGHSFGNNLTMVCVPETPMLNVPAAAPVAQPLLAAFAAAGAEYAQTGALAPETVAQLETPMIPAEAYLQIVNAQAAQMGAAGGASAP